jgi:hypothetical protein
MKDYSPEFLKSLGYIIPDTSDDQEVELLELEAKKIKLIL